MKLVLATIGWVVISLFLFRCGEQTEALINIDTAKGHSLEVGLSGFNVRIADKVWSYTHPDFIVAIDTLRPGWLRYFSGTMGDAFNAATGLYDYDYAWQFDHQKQYVRGYQFTKVKGPHTLFDLYQTLSRVNGKLVVTINGFTETPASAAELARFCKNNHIKVEAWQFCNEPYFYVPNRDRYWWNDGADYAAKMKPFADSIKSVFPDAKLALNFTWDGIWKFMKEIKSYQDENDRYWNLFSKHSYAPHTGKKESYEEAYRRANTKLIPATSSGAMQEIEEWSWERAPLMITEFGVWNRPLNGIYSSIYNAEYMLRQMAHPNAYLMGPHEISNKAVPATNRNSEIMDAFEANQVIETDTMRTGMELTDEGMAMYLLHQITNDVDFTYETRLEEGPFVPGMNGTKEQGWYARAFRGIGEYDYLMITNRSDKVIVPTIKMNDTLFDEKLTGLKITEGASKKEVSDFISVVVDSQNVTVDPYSVVMLKWKNGRNAAPSKTRIYHVQSEENGIRLKWWNIQGATGYRLKVTRQKKENTELSLNSDQNDFLLWDVESGNNYQFQVVAVNRNGESAVSETVMHSHAIPRAPSIYQKSRRFNTVTLQWRSVESASGYKVYIKDSSGKERVEDAKNTFGYRIEDLAYNEEYEFKVTAYNGLGESRSSKSVYMIPSESFPIPPRNLSAKETADGSVKLEWIVQDTINAGVKYKIYRGHHPFRYELLAENVIGNTFIDIKAGERTPYYAIKSYNKTGETNFFSNCATVIPFESQIVLEVRDISKDNDFHYVKVQVKNFPTDGAEYGVAITDLSFLNQDEKAYFSEGLESEYYTVKIPRAELDENKTYSVKALIITNGSRQYENPPFQKINEGKIAG